MVAGNWIALVSDKLPVSDKRHWVSLYPKQLLLFDLAHHLYT